VCPIVKVAAIGLDVLDLVASVALSNTLRASDLDEQCGDSSVVCKECKVAIRELRQVVVGGGIDVYCILGGVLLLGPLA
jgi:hypothetical protein